MWYTSLPSAIIIGSLLLSTEVVIYFSNKLVLGNPYKRMVYTYGDHYTYLRDTRLSGEKNSAYYQVGLDALPNLDKNENL